MDERVLWATGERQRGNFDRARLSVSHGAGNGEGTEVHLKMESPDGQMFAQGWFLIDDLHAAISAARTEAVQREAVRRKKAAKTATDHQFDGYSTRGGTGQQRAHCVCSWSSEWMTSATDADEQLYAHQRSARLENA